MAIAKVTGCLDDGCDDTLSNTIGETATTCYKTQVCNTIDNKPLELSGTIWYVIYYNQQLANDDALWNHDTYTSPVYQHYIKVNNYPIVLDDSITPTVNGDDGLVSATGTGRAPNLFNLHPGDVIVGPVGSKTYLFNVTDVVPTSIDNTGWSNITFNLIGPAIPGYNKYDNLEDKVADTLVYDSSYGLLTPDQDAERKDLTPFLQGAVKNYQRKVVDEQGLLTLTYQNDVIYDPEMSGFVNGVVGMVGGCGMSMVSGPTPSRSGGVYLTDLLLDRSLGLTSNLCRTRCMTSLDNATVANSDYFSLIVMSDYIVGDDYDFFKDSVDNSTPPCPPLDDGTNTDTSNCMIVDPPCCGCMDDPLNDVNTQYGRTVELDSETIPTIKDPFIDENYILSESFYTGDLANMSYLERMVYRYLHNETITIAELMVLWRDTVHWCSHAWFYYMPLLILLTKYAMANKGDCTISIGG